MKIQDLYAKYDIMPQLATHQLRVAGIAKIITDSWEDKATARECVMACLVHDMGNLVKFENLEDLQWRTIQDKYRAKYGKDAHDATIGILREVGLDKYATYMEEEKDLYLLTPDFPQFKQASKPAVLVLYADVRVSPTGVVTLEERTRDLEERYKNKRTEMIYGPRLEKYVQTLTQISVPDISEKDVEPLFDELLTYTI